MNYVGKVLQPGETIVYQTKLSWALYIPGALVILAAMLVFSFGQVNFATTWWTDLAGLAIAVIGLYRLATDWFERWTTEIAVTDRRIIFKRGFIRRDTIEMSVEKVESVDVQQSLLGRLLDYGDIIVRGTGAGLAPFRKIDAPLDFRSHVTGQPHRPAPAQPESPS